MIKHIEAGVSSKHPHEPEIPPILDLEGRCLICGLLCQIDELKECNAREQRRTNHARSQFSAEAQRGESLAAISLRAVQRLEACERSIALYDGDMTNWRQDEVTELRQAISEYIPTIGKLGDGTICEEA